MTTGLHDLQAMIWDALRYPTGVADWVEHLDDARRVAFESAIVSTDALDRVARLNIYAESYFWRLHGVLEARYPTVAWLVGPERFQNLTTDYVLHRPSVRPNLRHFGDRFVEFLRDHSTKHSFPHLPDVAATDEALDAALDAQDDPVLRPADLQAVPPERFITLRFRPRTTTRVHSSPWNYAALVHARREDALTPSPEDPRPADRVFHTVTHRKGWAVHHRSLEPDEAAALMSMMRGDTFAAQCEAAARANPDEADPAKVAAWLMQWLGDELIASVVDA